MIYVGIDDTDVPGSPGTNQLARAIVRDLAPLCRCVRIVRHQLLEHPDVPCTTKNGSASITLEPQAQVSIEQLVPLVRARMLAWFVSGSDPGLSIAANVPQSVSEFGRRCQRQLVAQDEARGLAGACGLYLAGLGGTEAGVIGALAAVGLAVTGDDGRVVQLGDWPDDLSGPQPVGVLDGRGVEVRELGTGDLVRTGLVDVGKHLRPNRRSGRDVLFVRREPDDSSPKAPYSGVRLP